MELCRERRGTPSTCLPIAGGSTGLRLPLAEIILDFFDQLKSRTKGYASIDYEFLGCARPTWSSSISCWRAKRGRPLHDCPPRPAFRPVAAAERLRRRSSASFRDRDPGGDRHEIIGASRSPR